MKARMSFLLLLVAGLLIGAQDRKDEAVQKEYAKLTGTWKIVSVEVEGAKPEEDFLKNARLVVKGDKFTFKRGDLSNGGTYKVDVTAKPKTIDITYTEGPEKGKTLLGIYDLEGDTGKICIALPGNDRPKEFVSKPGSGHVLEVLKREKM
jgi:uncharacterized protein (TIGR03067 family)